MFNLPNNQRNANYNFLNVRLAKSRHVAHNSISGLWEMGKTDSSGHSTNWHNLSEGCWQHTWHF